MNKTNDNQCCAARAYVLTSYTKAITGAESGLFCVLFTRKLTSEATVALTKTAETLGYGADGATFVNIGAWLFEPKTLFEIIEGLDPLCLVATDIESIQALGRTYRQDIKPLTSLHIHGRPTRAFPDFSSLMTASDLRQQAWAQLKTLPRILSPKTLPPNK